MVLLSGVSAAAIFNWNGISPLATDPPGNSTSGEAAIDLRYFYAMLASGNLDFRIDVTGNLAATPAPTVTSIAPTSGPTAGGTTVTITGTNFTGATAVKFGTVSALPFTVIGSTQITVTAPAGAAGMVDVTVTTAGGTSATSAADQYTYVAAPTVTSIAPTSGPTAGGTTVTITGTNFTGTTAVKFGATNATSFTVNSATQITATAAAGAAGMVDVTVTTAGGTSATSAADQYTYVAAPTVTSIAPTSGPTAGGTTVTITGTNFTGTTAVKFGATNATSFTVIGSTQITATAPAGAGTVDVTVTTAGGTSATSAADQYTYLAAPSVTSISPATGPVAGGTTVTITGTNFTGATAAKFGATNATSFTVNSSTQITATAPAGAGTVDVTVTTAGGTSATSAADQYTYANPPVATNDTYTTVGNTALVVGVATPATPYVSSSTLLLANDTGSGGFNITITQLPSGTITNLDTNTGAFVYTPPAGFTGTDTFKYTVTDSTTQTSAPATVTITVSGRVWYVNGTAGTNGNGVSSSPFNTLLGVSAASGDTIFVQSAGAPTSTNGAISLAAGVILWGQGTALPAISGITIGNTGATSKPVLKGAVTLVGSNSTISSLDIDTSSTPGTIALSNTGAPSGITIQNNVGVTSNGATAVKLNGASGSFTFVRITANSIGAANAAGISLTNVGGTGFTVTGDGATAGSGGVISGSCSTGIAGCGAVQLSNAGTVALNWMNLSSTTGSGVYATDTPLTVANSTIANYAVVGVFLQTTSLASGTFNLHDNTVSGTNGDAIQVQVNSSGTWTGHIKANTIGSAATANSGALGGDGIGVDVAGTGTATVDVSNNKVYQIRNGVGIRATSTTGTLNASVLSNTVSMVQISGLDGISVGSSSTVCLNATGNTSAATGTAAGNSQYDAVGLSVLQNTTSSVFRIQGYGGPAANDAAVQTYLNGINTLSGPAGPSIADHTSQGNVNGFGAAVCATAP
ncbi:MAG: IPT/TIG domain-containing protein [Proteobacteria bacterium]|nr:IPT/TIG domain-containing protein [Pseudomonadota bacterium]